MLAASHSYLGFTRGTRITASRPINLGTYGTIRKGAVGTVSGLGLPEGIFVTWDETQPKLPADWSNETLLVLPEAQVLCAASFMQRFPLSRVMAWLSITSVAWLPAIPKLKVALMTPAAMALNWVITLVDIWSSAS